MTTAAAHTPIAGDDGDDGRTTRARMLPPPTLSINRLITTHARERLVVHPLLWTDRHLALLQCRFHPHGDVVAEQDGTLTPPSVPEDPRLDPRRLRRRLPFLDLEDVVYGLLTSVGYQDAASMTTSRERFILSPSSACFGNALTSGTPKGGSAVLPQVLACKDSVLS